MGPLFLVLLTTLFQGKVAALTQKLAGVKDDEDVRDLEAMDQDLDSFFHVLGGKQRQSWIREEIICKNRLNMERL